MAKSNADKNLEMKLMKIIRDDVPKNIVINKQKYYISRPMLDKLKKIVSDESERVVLKGEKEGGFFPLILGALGALGALAGGAAGVAGTVLNNNREKDKLAEQARHNSQMEKTLSGSGFDVKGFLENVFSKVPEMHRKVLKATLKHVSPYINITQTHDGNGLILYPQSQKGNGLLLYPSDIN